MTLTAILIMILVLSIIWGGFITAILVAIRKEKWKNREKSNQETEAESNYNSATDL